MALRGIKVVIVSLHARAPSFNIKRMIPIRYLDAKWINDFFVAGRLMLSTYEKCRTHEDLSRRDEREGKGNFHITDGLYALTGIQTSGSRSYILCTSLSESSALMRHFGTDDYFRIVDVPGFCKAISSSLSGFLSYKFGRCKYLPERSVVRNTLQSIPPDPSELLEAAKVKDQRAVEESFYRMNAQLAKRIDDEISDEIYFLKENTSEVKDEFRMIWTVNEDVVAPKEVVCPDATQFCQRRLSDPGSLLAR